MNEPRCGFQLDAFGTPCDEPATRFFALGNVITVLAYCDRHGTHRSIYDTNLLHEITHGEWIAWTVMKE